MDTPPVPTTRFVEATLVLMVKGATAVTTVTKPITSKSNTKRLIIVSSIGSQWIVQRERTSNKKGQSALMLGLTFVTVISNQ
jgi:hypothetical protein